MTRPRISVVVPTRNRPDTLEVCLRALARHESPHIEIVVQDNSTNPASQQVVERATKLDPRIKYSQAPYPTSQRHNFELGLAAATGDYMTIIGDDDGFSLGSLDWLADQLHATPVDAVRWNLLHYVWPSLSQDGEGFMDLYHSMASGTWSIEPAAPLAAKALAADTQGSWDNLLIYHGMISRRVYDKMRAITDGVFFPYPMPDVYAHNLIPVFCDTYLQVNDLVSIYGVSGHSAGASWTQSRSPSGGAAAEGNRWMMESVADEVAKNLPWQPDIRTLRYHDFAALKLAETRGMLGGAVLSTEVWTAAIIAELKANSTQIAPWFAVEPKAPFDAAIIARVRDAFPNNADAPAKASNKKSADDRIPSLRVQAVSADYQDDIEGAMLALGDLVGRSKSRFIEVPTSSEPGAVSVRQVLLQTAKRVRKIAPGLTSRVIGSPYLPKVAWRFLKNLQQREPEPSHAGTYKLQASIVDMNRRHEKRRQTKQNGQT